MKVIEIPVGELSDGALDILVPVVHGAVRTFRSAALGTLLPLFVQLGEGLGAEHRRRTCDGSTAAPMLTLNVKPNSRTAAVFAAALRVTKTGICESLDRQRNELETLGKWSVRDECSAFFTALIAAL